MTRDYCPYTHLKHSEPVMPDYKKGIALMMGDDFIIVPRAVLKRHGIPVRKTERELCFGDKCKPVYEKANWDCCHEMNLLFCEYEKYKVADFAVRVVYTLEHGVISRHEVEW